jgi:hypothetical protein
MTPRRFRGPRGRLIVERLGARHAWRRDPSAVGPASGLSLLTLWRGFFEDDRAALGLKAVLLAALLIAMAWRW